jgi:hypothetical protein
VVALYSAASKNGSSQTKATNAEHLLATVIRVILRTIKVSEIKKLQEACSFEND